MRSPGEVAVISTAGAGIGRGTAMIVAREGGTGVGRGLEPTLPERLRADVTPRVRRGRQHCRQRARGPGGPAGRYFRF